MHTSQNIGENVEVSTESNENEASPERSLQTSTHSANRTANSEMMKCVLRYIKLLADKSTEKEVSQLRFENPVGVLDEKDCSIGTVFNESTNGISTSLCAEIIKENGKMKNNKQSKDNKRIRNNQKLDNDKHQLNVTMSAKKKTNIPKSLMGLQKLLDENRISSKPNPGDNNRRKSLRLLSHPPGYFQTKPVMTIYIEPAPICKNNKPTRKTLPGVLHKKQTQFVTPARHSLPTRKKRRLYDPEIDKR